MPSARFGLRWIVATFVAGAVLTLVLVDRLVGLDLDNPAAHLVVEFAGTLALTVVGTFVGAYAAFALQTRREDAKDGATRRAALRRAAFALIAQVQVLETLRRELAPWRDDPDRDLRLKALVYYQEIPTIDLVSIEFLLETSDPDLLNVLLDSQNKWHTAIGAMEDRSREHRRFLERLEAVLGKDAQGVTVTGAALRAAVGPEISGALRSRTDGLYDAVDTARAANDASWERLSAQSAAQVPGAPPFKRSLDPEVVGSGSAGA